VSYYDLRQYQSFNPPYPYTYAMMSAFYFLDEDVITTQRNAFCLVDVMQKIGGMMGVVTAICNLLVGRFQKRLYEDELLKTLQYEEHERDYN
jgi:hypothetical protein